jgi:hypothetical protein
LPQVKELVGLWVFIWTTEHFPCAQFCNVFFYVQGFWFKVQGLQNLMFLTFQPSDRIGCLDPVGLTALLHLWLRIPFVLRGLGYSTGNPESRPGGKTPNLDHTNSRSAITKW